jgi:hypothetical protein
MFTYCHVEKVIIKCSINIHPVSAYFSQAIFLRVIKMLLANIDEVSCIAILELDGSLSEDDFCAAAKEIDPFN